MANTDKRIDAYIARSADFARPILTHLRELVHTACPEVEETIKWGMPFFDYKGPFCSMAAFKQHAIFGFWKGSLLEDRQNFLRSRHSEGGEAMGNLGKLTDMESMQPDDVIIDFIKQAKMLNDKGIKLPAKPKIQKSDLEAPDYFLAALNNNKEALKTYTVFSPSNKKEYLEWVSSAKGEDTRTRRLETAMEWMAEGKVKNWKYIKK